MKLIVFSGSERCDVSYFAGRVLRCTGGRVIVIDNSRTKDLFETIHQGVDLEDDEFEFERDGITYLKDVAYSPEFFEAFDYVIIHEGRMIDKMLHDVADLVYMMSDYYPQHLKRIRGYDAPNVEYLMLDKVPKINDTSAAELMQAPLEKIIGGLPYESTDYACYLSFLYNGSQSFSALSGEYKDFLSYLLMRAADFDEKKSHEVCKASQLTQGG